MKKSKKILLALLGSSCLTITGCGQTPFGALGGFQSNDISSNADESVNVTVTPYALLSAEQVYKSMVALTGTESNPRTMNEYNARQSVLSSSFDLKTITSPMLISITNLASVFCNETLAREVALQSGQRKFFGNVDFAKGVKSLDPASYTSAIDKLSGAFWGRSPSSDEAQVLNESREDFVSALNATEVASAISSRNLMLFTCTGMLSSFDSYSF